MATPQGPRDVMVTGMGFCLPGPGGGYTVTRDDFWRTISTASVHIGQDGVWFGALEPPVDMVSDWFPEVPDRHLANYAPAHHYGLAATAAALEDAGLERGSAQLSEAALVTARMVSDSWYAVFEDFLASEQRESDPEEGRALFSRLAISGGVNDLAHVAASLLGTGGPCVNVSAGCASGAAALSDAHRMISTGLVDVAVVSGVDYRSLDLVHRFNTHYERVDKAGEERPAAMNLSGPMRPYDRRTAGSNLASGGATLILESREHARRRGARVHVDILGQAHRRAPSGSALAADVNGEAVLAASRQVLGRSGVAPNDVHYVNGGAEGNAVFHGIETRALSALLGERVHGFPVSVQEGCFGHNGSPLGLTGVAATALMMNHGEVCPTTNCEQVDEECVFDPVPGHRTKPHDIGVALSFNYHPGSGATAVLMGRHDEAPAQRSW